MTISTTDNKAVHTANGTQDTFPYDFKIFAEGDLAVYEDDVLTTKAYTVSDVGAASGGDVVFTSDVPADAVTVSLIRESDYTQETDYTAYGPFPAETHEAAIDKIVMQVQQIKELDERKFGLPVGESLTSLTVAPIANRVIGFDATGANLTTISPTTVTAVAFDVLSNYDDLAAAVTAIGAGKKTLVIDAISEEAADVTVPSNIWLMPIDGATLKPATGKTITVYSPEHIIASPRQQIVDLTNNPDDPLAFTNEGIITPQWWGAMGDGVTDDTVALTALRNCIAANPEVTAVFPAGIYVYTTSPNWAIQNANIRFEGIVRLRNTGAGNNVILDAGASPAVIFNVYFGFDNPPLIEGASTTGHGIFIRSVHHSKIGANVRGCGTSSNAFTINFSVVNEYNFITSVNEGAFYSSGQPQHGIYLTERDTGEQVSACTFYNPIIEGVSAIGIQLVEAIQNRFIGGTSEANLTGVDVGEDCDNNVFEGTDLEVNTSGTGLIDRGSFNTFNDILNDELTAITATARGSKFNGGSLDDISDLGTGTKLYGVNYSNNSGVISAAGTGLEKIGVFKISSSTYDDNVLQTLKIASGQTIKKHLHSSIAAGAFAVPGAVPGVSVKTGLSVTGVAVGDTVVVSSSVVLASNYSMYGIVVSTDVVEIRVHQYTGAAASPFPSGATIKIDIWAH